MNRCRCCGQEIGDEARQCPSCGQDAEGKEGGQDPRKTDPGKRLRVVGIVLGGVGAVLIHFSWSWTILQIGDALFIAGFLVFMVGAVISQWHEYRRGRPTSEALKELLKKSYMRLILGLLIMAISSIVLLWLRDRLEGNRRQVKEEREETAIEEEPSGTE